MSITYKDSGVDITGGHRAVEMMKKFVSSTYDENVIGDIGSFGGLYSIENFKLKRPVLVAGADGVGTKLKYAFALQKFDTVGIDCVAMNVDDVVCQGAKPLFFLDYIACGKREPEIIAEIVKGAADGCRQAGAALIGGETAEMPGFYKEGEYDLAGFAVGIVDKDEAIIGNNIRAGDVLIGLPSSGLHSNGYSLVRKLFDPEDKKLMNSYSDELGMKIGEALLAPTKIYAKTALSLIAKFKIHGVSHITGGAYYKNIPRLLPEGLGIELDLNSYEVPPIFKMIVQRAGLPKEEAYKTFNMGVGMVFMIDKGDADKFMREAVALGEKPSIIGSVTGRAGVKL
jgi:phosphoribosylaminoimidazole synthetase